MNDTQAYENWLQGSVDRDVIIRTYEGHEIRAEPNTGYKLQTACSVSVGTLSLYVDTDYIGSFTIGIIFKALDIVDCLTVDNSFTMTIKGLFSTIKQRG